MHILRVEHSVSDFDAWKQAFDSDPVGRERGGVRRMTVESALTTARSALPKDNEASFNIRGVR